MCSHEKVESEISRLATSDAVRMACSFSLGTPRLICRWQTIWLCFYALDSSLYDLHLECVVVAYPVDLLSTMLTKMLYN
ncbi:hypothetical protein PROFUN_01730 [Planoprotostelium fungivorum]|uniref:Uncharacterized protein n=1 Tax=Planoprotostelium fungivorum TaxID=1890364 RepID=A0A2P6MWD2_9EUKA|nr:hypothetical protein PROFUN_01730 [Planoprotostelium fungivorum]